MSANIWGSMVSPPGARRLPFPRRRTEDGDRYHLWPIRLGISPPTMRRSLTHHGWQTGSEEVPKEQTSVGCMPGYRRVFGQTLTIGPIQIRIGNRTRV